MIEAIRQRTVPTDNPRSAVGRYLFRNTGGPRSIWTRLDELQSHVGNPTSPVIGYHPVYILNPNR